jgi:GxxExxY protein
MENLIAEPKYPEQELTEKIIGCAFEVHNTLGAGFLEQVYVAALTVEMQLQGLRAAREVPYEIQYRGRSVGSYFADIVVEGRVLVELKSCAVLNPAHYAQAINYLRASKMRVALVMNFGRPKLEFRRVVL